MTLVGPRVLIVAPRLDLGGTEIHLLRTLPRLRRGGLDVSLFTIESGGRLGSAFKAADVPVLGISSSAGRILRDLLAARALRKTLCDLRPDILHFFLAEPYLIGSLAAVGLGGFRRVMSRRSLAHYQRNYALLGGLERLLHRSLDALIGNSEAVAAELIKEGGHSSKVGIIHNGIDLPAPAGPDVRERRRRELAIPENAFAIAVIANLIEYKGHADLISGLALVSRELGPNWRLLLVGRDQGIGAALREQAASLGIEEHIVWLGEMNEPQQVLAAADVGVLPSHEEGFSNSLIEKMAHGLAVVATRVGGNIDAIVDDESGLLVPPRDPEALGAAIAKLQDDTDLRVRLGAAARLHVARQFSMDRCVQRYLNLYRGLLRSEDPVPELIDSPEFCVRSDCDFHAAPSIPSQ